MTGRHRLRARVVAVVATTLALLLGGSAAAWAWWAASTTAAVSGTAPVLPAPGGVVATCNPQYNFANDPVVISWSPVAIPTGASAVRYRVLFVSDNAISRYFPSATTETTTTSVSVDATQLGTTTADRVRAQTITVQAIAQYPAGTLVSGASASVAAHGEVSTVFIFFSYVDMVC